MAKWARKKQIPARFTGIDNNPDIIAYLKEHCKDYPEINGVAATYQDYPRQMKKWTSTIVHFLLTIWKTMNCLIYSHISKNIRGLVL
jgi:hypothetical protein